MSDAKVAPGTVQVIHANYDGLVANSSWLTQVATKIVTGKTCVGTFRTRGLHRREPT